MNEDVSILIVEDSLTQAMQLRHILEKHNYHVLVAHNGNEALVLLNQHKPTLIISDIVMPEMNGYELCKKIKSDEHLKTIPLILLTSLSDPLDILKGLENGADNFLTKPYDEKLLLSRISYILLNREMRKSERAQVGVEILFDGQKFTVTPERQQILDLLISTYETAVQKNLELIKVQDELKTLNESLEEKVRERTEELMAEMSERLKIEVALRASEERFSVAFNASPISSVITTLNEGRYVAVNDTFLNVTGYKREEVIGRTASDLNIWLSSEDRAEVIKILNTEGRIRNREKEYRMKDGEKRVFLTSAEIIELDAQPHLITASVDITERKRAEEALHKSEEQLRQSQKMEAIGKLAGGIAHDFNNLLTIIAGYSDILFKMLDDNDPKRYHVTEIRLAGERAATLTRQLLAFSRRQMLEPKVLNLNNVVSNIEKMLERLIGEDIILTTILHPSINKIKVDPGQMEQVIMNLAVNARDAMPRGGRLTIETSNIVLQENRWLYEFDYTPGNYVMLTMTDTGCGMTPEVKAQIFEPFFTTKEQGKGTGLGLSTVFGIIKQSGGHITVYSEQNVGTTFKIYFPAEEAEVFVPKTDKTHEVIEQGSETILLVEDEEGVRKIAKLGLETYGYNVLEASDGNNAMNIAEQYKGTIHLVISDVVMPGLSGSQLVEILRSLYPSLKVLFISGYTDDAIVRHGIIEEEHAFLQKPFTPVSLVKKVHEVLKKQDGKNID